MVDLITCDEAVELYDNCDQDEAGWSGYPGSGEHVEVRLLAYPYDDDRPMVTLLEKHMTKEEFKKLEDLEFYTY